MPVTETKPNRQLNLLVASVPTPSVKACCQTGTGTGAGPDAPAVALVGAPNTGKSRIRRSVRSWMAATTSPQPLQLQLKRSQTNSVTPKSMPTLGSSVMWRLIPRCLSRQRCGAA